MSDYWSPVVPDGSNDDDLVLQTEGGSDELSDVGVKEGENDCEVSPQLNEILLQYK